MSEDIKQFEAFFLVTHGSKPSSYQRRLTAELL